MLRPMILAFSWSFVCGFVPTSAFAQQTGQLHDAFARLAGDDNAVDRREYMKLLVRSPSRRLQGRLNRRFNRIANTVTLDNRIDWDEFLKAVRPQGYQAGPPDVYWPEIDGYVLDAEYWGNAICVWVLPPWESDTEYEVWGTIVPASTTTYPDPETTNLFSDWGEYMACDLDVGTTGETLEELTTTAKKKIVVWIKEREIDPETGEPGEWSDFSLPTVRVFHAHTPPVMP